MHRLIQILLIYQNKQLDGPIKKYFYVGEAQQIHYHFELKWT